MNIEPLLTNLFFIVCEVSSDWTEESLSSLNVSIIDRNDNYLSPDQGLRQFKFRFESIKVTCKDEMALFLPFESFEDQIFRLAKDLISILF